MNCLHYVFQFRFTLLFFSKIKYKWSLLIKVKKCLSLVLALHCAPFKFFWSGSTVEWQRCDSGVTEVWQWGANRSNPKHLRSNLSLHCHHRWSTASITGTTPASFSVTASGILGTHAQSPSILRVYENKRANKTPPLALWIGGRGRDGAWAIPRRWQRKAEMQIHTSQCRQSRCGISSLHRQKHALGNASCLRGVEIGTRVTTMGRWGWEQGWGFCQDYRYPSGRGQLRSWLRWKHRWQKN